MRAAHATTTMEKVATMKISRGHSRAVVAGLAALTGLLCIAWKGPRLIEMLAEARIESCFSAGGPDGLPEFSTVPIGDRENLIGGRVELAYHGSDRLPGSFYMALMIKADTGEPITDFFGQQAGTVSPYDPEGPFLREEVPRYRGAFSIAPEDRGDFPDDFPQYQDGPFLLTFRKFEGRKYWLRNVPRGRAYLWFLTSFDGWRVTQMPICVRLEPHPGEATRVDLLDVNALRTFIEL